MESELKAGRELDAEVVEKVFGLKVVSWETCTYADGCWSIHPDLPTEGWACHAAREPVYFDPDLAHFDKDDDYDPDDPIDRGSIAFRERAGHDIHACEVVPNYSTSIEDAWLVVEKLASNRREWKLHHRPGEYLAILRYGHGPNQHWSSYGSSMPEAICLAALAALQQKEG